MRVGEARITMGGNHATVHGPRSSRQGWCIGQMPTTKSGHREERLIAAQPGAGEVPTALIRQTIALADGGVETDGERVDAGSGLAA
jgi:hypothetical protein